MTIHEYYKGYLSLHQNKINRRLHVAGVFLTIMFILYSIVTKNWLILPLSLLIVYPFAWSGHIFFEKNKPAAWSSPVKAKICDLIMTKDILRGKIEW